LHTSRLSQLAIAVAAISAGLFVSMPLLAKLGAVSGFLAFRLFMLGGLLSLLALLLGLGALFTTRASKGRAGRGLAWGACGLAVAVIVAVAVSAGPSAGVPPINDITTDPLDPPQFAALARDPENADRDMSYPGEPFASQQRAGYPDLAPIDLATSPTDTFEASKNAIESFGWQIVAADAAAGTIEATDTSRIFRFVDDISVRVRPLPTGARVDMRSKSRVGLGDMGANAARIRRLRDSLGIGPASSESSG
jgi:uncharacterized protein (DUF1499 family)